MRENLLEGLISPWCSTWQSSMLWIILPQPGGRHSPAGPGIPSATAQCRQQRELRGAGASAVCPLTQALVCAVPHAFLLPAYIYLPEAQQKWY